MRARTAPVGSDRGDRLQRLREGVCAATLSICSCRSCVRTPFHTVRADVRGSGKRLWLSLTARWLKSQRGVQCSRGPGASLASKFPSTSYPGTRRVKQVMNSPCPMVADATSAWGHICRHSTDKINRCLVQKHVSSNKNGPLHGRWAAIRECAAPAISTVAARGRGFARQRVRTLCRSVTCAAPQ